MSHTQDSDPRPAAFVLFGATGDLARRMVLPAFFRLATEGLLPAQWLLVGNGRGDVSHEDFRARVHDALTEFGPQPEPFFCPVAIPVDQERMSMEAVHLHG